MSDSFFGEEQELLLKKIKEMCFDKTAHKKNAIKKLLQKFAPQFDWTKFDYRGTFGNSTDGGILLLFEPNLEYFEVLFKDFDWLYLNLVSEASDVKKEEGYSSFQHGAIEATYALIKTLYKDKPLVHDSKKNKAFGILIKWFYKERLIEGYVKTGNRFVSVKCSFSPTFIKTFYIPNNASLEEVASFLYLHDRLPTRAEAGEWFYQKLSVTNANIGER